MSMDPYSGDPLITDLGDGGDLTIQGGQPKMSSGLENSVYLSWEVDANWWGNFVDPASPGPVGSRYLLPLLRRSKLTPDTLKDAKAAAEADLAWMIEDGAAKSVSVETSIIAVGWLGLEATITEPDGTTSTVRWTLNWARLAQEIGHSLDVPMSTPDRSRYGQFEFQNGAPIQFADGMLMNAKEQT